MSSNEERREAAKRKLEERLEAEQQAAHRRRMIWGAIGAVVLLIVAGVATFIGLRIADNKRRVDADCVYTDAQDPFAGLPAQFPADQFPEEQRETYKALFGLYTSGRAKQRKEDKPSDLRPYKDGTIPATIDTNLGNVPVTLDRAQAPCNVNAFVALAKAGYYDSTPCHAMFLSEGNKLAICGDPTGTALSSPDFVLGGNPGWELPDEPPTGLKAGPNAGELPGQQSVIYPRGSVIMLTTQASDPSGMGGGANYGGGAYMLVLADSEMPANYPLIGHVDESGLAVLDKIRDGGLKPGVGAPAPQAGKPLTSGAPKEEVLVKSVNVS